MGSRTSLELLLTMLRQSGQHLIEDAPFQPNAHACASASCTTVAKSANTRDRSWADAAVAGADAADAAGDGTDPAGGAFNVTPVRKSHPPPQMEEHPQIHLKQLAQAARDLLDSG